MTLRSITDDLVGRPARVESGLPIRLSFIAQRDAGDEQSKYPFDLQGPRNPARSAMDTRAAQLARLRGGRYCAIESSGAVRGDGTGFAGWFGDGAPLVAVSAEEKCGWLSRVPGGVIGDPRIGPIL
jgi:hypothetical protein